MWRGCHTSVDSGDLNQTPPKQSAVCSTGIILSPVAKVLWTCVIISPEEIPELQRPRRATGNRRNLQCEDDSILRANVTRDTLSGCGGGPRSGGRPCWLSVSLCCIAPLIHHSSAWVERPSAPGSWGRYVSWDPVHDLASARGHEWLATCVPVQDVLSQGILSSSTTSGISGCSEEALHVTAIWW